MRLHAVKTFVKSVQPKSSEDEDQSPANVLRAEDNLIKLKPLNFAEGEFDMTAEKDKFETPNQLQNQRYPIPTDSSPESIGKAELRDTLEDIQPPENKKTNRSKP
jgi:hypothetical protein